MKLTPAEILEEAKERKGVSSSRLSMYRRSADAYHGVSQDDGQFTGMSATGAPMLRLNQLRNDLSRRVGAPNMLMPIVDDFVALKGVVPTMRVLPWDETDDAREKAAKFSRLVRTQWSQSHMELQCYKLAWYLSALGDGLVTLNPIFPEHSSPLRPAGIYLSVIDPSHAFPLFKTGWDSEELKDVIIWEKIPKRQVKAQWGVISEEDKVDVLWYVSDDYNCITVAGRVVEEVQHDLGFCPAQWIKNKVNGRPAQSDIGPAIDSHAEMQIMIMVMNDSLLETTYSQLVIRNPVNVQEKFETGPGADPIVIQGDGSVDRLNPAPMPNSAEMLMTKTWELIQRMSGSAPVRTENQIPGSNISGKSVHAQQGPMETRLSEDQTVLGYHYQAINSKMLHMFYTIPDFRDADMNIFGTEKGRPFKITMRGEEIDGWTQNSCQWSAMIGQTAHERAVVGLQLKGADIVPDVWVLDQIGVDDAEMLVQQAKKEAQAKMEQQAAAQRPPDAGQQNQAMEKGATPGGNAGSAVGSNGQSPPGGGSPQSQPPPPGLPAFPPVDTAPTKAGFGNPPPVPDVGSRIQEILQSVEALILSQVTNVKLVPGGIHITLKSATDQEKAHDRGLLRQAFSEFGSVHFSEAKPLWVG
jgi:hypothetical protein